MNAQEKHDSDVATCRCCLLADAMKPCKNGCHCRFEVGLVADTTPNHDYRAKRAAEYKDWLARINSPAMVARRGTVLTPHGWRQQIAELRAG